MSYRIVPTRTATVNVIPAPTDRSAGASKSDDDVIVVEVVSANEVRNRQRTAHPMSKNVVTPIPKTRQRTVHPMSKNFVTSIPKTSTFVPVFPSQTSVSPPAPAMLTAISKEHQLQYEAKAAVNDRIKNECVSSSSNSPALSDCKSSITGTLDPIDTTMDEILLDSPMPSSKPSPMQSMRELQPSEWEYGFDAAGASNKRFIVFEPQSRSYVREYGNDGPDMGCATSQTVSAKLVNGILLVPLPNAHRCEPRPYSSILEQQKKYGEKGRRKRGRTVDPQLMKKKAKAVAHDTSNNPDGDAFDEAYAEMNTSKPTETHEAENSVGNNDVAAPVAVVQVTAESNLYTSVAYFNPSASLIAKWCKKLQMKYSGEAYKFWSNIEFSKIRPTSVPESCHAMAEETYHGFSCLSLYLTGSEAKAPLIKDMINQYVFENYKSLGIWRGQNFSQCDLQTPVISATILSFSLTDVHHQCVSQWFQCRIGVFADGKWKRFGNWDEEEANIPTMLMEFKKEKYFPILKLAG